MIKHRVTSILVVLLLITTLTIGNTLGSENVTVWYQAEGEGYIYYLNTTSPVATATTFELANHLSLCAEVFKVVGPTDYEDSNDYTRIDIYIGITGNSEHRTESEYDDFKESINPHSIKVQATLSNQDHPANIYWSGVSKGINTGGDKQPLPEENIIPLQNTVFHSAEAIATTALPMLNAVYFANALVEDFSNVEYLENIHVDSGPGAHIQQGWNIYRNNQSFIYDLESYPDGGYLREGTINFTATSKFSIDIPVNYNEELSVSMSASLLMRKFTGATTTDEWGAQTEDVTITIKNGEPSIISGLTTDKEHYHTSDYGKGWVRPVFQNLMIDNVAGSTDPGYEVTIEYYAYWSTGGTGWTTLTYDWFSIYEEVNKAATINVPEGQENRRVDIRYTITAHDIYGGWELGPFTISDMFRITDNLEPAIEVTALEKEAYEESYGDYTYEYRIDNNAEITGEFVLEVTSDPAWPVTVHPDAFLLASGSDKTVDVTVTIPDGVSDGASAVVKLTATASEYTGGGGCPYVSPWNGTDYQLDNNILIASEHQAGIVDDHYILQNGMEPKDGYYSLKIEEFENSKDHLDTVKLYTIDHQEGYEIATTPGGEFIAYKEPIPALSAYDSNGDDVLGYLNDTDNDTLYVEENSDVILNFGEITKDHWKHNKLVVVSHGFESYTDVPPSDTNPWTPPKEKTSLHTSLRMDGSEWKNITVLHPRNNPVAMVIPLNETLEEFFPGRKGNILGELEVRILSTDDHYIDFVGMDDSVPAEPTKVQEAALESALLNDETDVAGLLSTNDTEMVTLIPGEYISLDFDIPEQSPAPVFSERSFMFYSSGYYELFMGANEVGNTIMSSSDDLLSETVTASATMTVTFNHPGSSVSVTAPSDMNVNDYGTYRVEFTVENQGDLWDTYDLTVTETEGWTVTAADTVTVEPGTSVPVEVEVNIPTTASDGASTIALTATSQHGGQTNSANMNINFVYQHPGSSVSVTAPSDVYESTTGTKTYTFTVRNTGDLADTYDLTLAKIGGNSWTRSIDGDTTISLNAGQTKNVDVKITIPSSVSDGDYMDIRLRATSQNGGQTDSDSMSVTFVEPPYVEITRPVNGAIIYVDRVTVEWEGEGGIDTYWIRLGDGSWINVGTSTSYTFENLSTGRYTVYVRARKDGVYGYDSVTFEIDMMEITISAMM